MWDGQGTAATNPVQAMPRVLPDTRAEYERHAICPERSSEALPQAGEHPAKQPDSQLHDKSPVDVGPFFSTCTSRHLRVCERGSRAIETSHHVC